jgi:hypothetical protein
MWISVNELQSILSTWKIERRKNRKRKEKRKKKKR